MKKTIRLNTFETNSSSCHSLVFKNLDLQPNMMPVNKENKIICHYGNYEDFYGELDTQDEKLSYILSHIAVDSIKDSLYNDYKFKILEQSIMKYTGCNGLYIDDCISNASLNHQLYDSLNEIVDIYNYNNLISFIFSQSINVVIDRD